MSTATPGTLKGGGIYALIQGPNATSLVVADYPASPVEGNDDTEIEVTEAELWGENSNPYDELPSNVARKGVLYDTDKPAHPVALNVPPPNGAAIEVKLQFREFCRLEVNGKWYRIADFFLWRHHGKLTKNPHDRNGDGSVKQSEVYDWDIKWEPNNEDW